MEREKLVAPVKVGLDTYKQALDSSYHDFMDSNTGNVSLRQCPTWRTYHCLFLDLDCPWKMIVVSPNSALYTAKLIVLPTAIM
jgi:hypothetical protein